MNKEKSITQCFLKLDLFIGTLVFWSEVQRSFKALSLAEWEELENSPNNMVPLTEPKTVAQKELKQQNHPVALNLRDRDKVWT